jgi:integrase
LTAVRTSEAIGASWSEIDFDACLWRIPGERMKTKKPHDVPLAPQTIAVLERMAAIRQNDFVFPGLIRSRPISNMAMLALLKRLGLKGVVTTHGMRATFKTWASEATDFDRLAVERCLAHEIGNAVEASYLRGELLGKRKVIMQAWADHCCGDAEAAGVQDVAAA